MTDDTTQRARCEPAEGWRDVAGWHLLQRGSGDERPWFWVPSDDVGQPHWANLGCPAQAHHDGYRYLAPVTPPDVVRALVEALEHADQQLEYIDQRNPSGTTPAVRAQIAHALSRAKEAGL